MKKTNLNGFEYLQKLVKKRGVRDDLKNSKFILIFQNDRRIDCRFDIAAMTDNGKDPENPAYEEYFGIYFQNIETRKYVEVSKYQYPKIIIINGVEVYHEK